MSDDFTFDDLTRRLVDEAAEQAKAHPRAAGTPDDPYDLLALSQVIVPPGTPLLNILARTEVPAYQGDTLTVSVCSPKQRPSLYTRDDGAFVFARLLYVLKFAEQALIDQEIEEWAIAHGVARDHRYLDVKELASLVKIGVAQDYQGYAEDLGDTVRYTVSICITVIITESPEPARA
jgi:hypothetical protein